LYRIVRGRLCLARIEDDSALRLSTPHVINLLADPKEREPYSYPYLHTSVFAHVGKIIYQSSVKREPLIPAGASLDYVPRAAAP
jgi:arylsulfatase